MAKIKVEIKGKDITDYVYPETIAVTDSLKIKSDSLSLEMKVENQEIPKPQGGNPIKVIDEEDGKPIFAGAIITVTQKQINPIAFSFSVEAMDYTRSFDRRLVSEKYKKEEAVASDIVKELILGGTEKVPIGYAPDFTTNNVVPTTIKLPELVFDAVYLSACLDEIAEKIGWMWYVDFDKDVHFFPYEWGIPPALIETWGALYLDGQFGANLEAYGGLELSEDVSNLKNFIVLKDVKAQSKFSILNSFWETLTMFFTFKWEPFTPTNIDWETLPRYITGRIISSDEIGSPSPSTTDAVVEKGDCSQDTPITFVIKNQPPLPQMLYWVLTSRYIKEAKLEIIGDAGTWTFTANDTNGWSGFTNKTFGSVSSVKMLTRIGSGKEEGTKEKDILDVGNHMLRLRIDGVESQGPWDELGDDRTIFVNFTTNGFRVSDKLQSVLKDNPKWGLDLAYNPVEETLLPFLDPDSVLEMQAREGADSSGIYEYIASEPALWTRKGEEASAVAEMILERDAWPVLSGSFTSFKKGWKAGQRFLIYSEQWGNRGEPLIQTVYVTSVALSVLPEGKLQSTISFSNNKYGD